MPIADCQLPIEKREPMPLRRIEFGTWRSAFGLRRVPFGSEPQGRRLSSRNPLPAFTLVELMISLAMVLLLIIGINYVFRSATDAVSAGQALNAINSDAQATQPLLFDDLRNISKNPPCFIIASQLVTQFKNSDDAKTSSDPTVIPIDNAGNYDAIWAKPANLTVNPTQIISPAILNDRNHQQDMLMFFAHGNYHRRSGNDGTYIGSESSDDAFIQIGAAALPANDLSAFYGPSSLPNTTTGLFNGVTVTGVPRLGAYASDWVLGRRIILLDGTWATTPPNPPITPGDFYYATVVPPTANPLGINSTSTAPLTAQFGANMSPLSYGTQDSNVTPATPTVASTTTDTQFQQSRYDLAGVTPDQFDRIVANAILGWQSAGYLSPTATTPASLWWNPLVYALPIIQGTTTPPQPYPRPAATPPDTLPNPPYVLSYFSAVPGYTANSAFSPTANTARPAIDPGLWLNRPQCNPLIQSPVTAAAIAEMSPYFLQHCSQFIVEYAGDYMQQDNNQFFPVGSATVNTHYGAMTGLGPDGQIDFYVDANGNKHIRWYGMPRSSTGTLHAGDQNGTQILIRGYNIAKTTAGGSEDPTASGTAGNYNAPLNYFTDVIPLRDYYTMYLNVGITPALLYAPPWEVDVNFDPPGASEDYATNPVKYGSGNKIAFGDFNNPPRYVAAWHDDMPAMIRILIKVDDPNNKVKDGPWYEYVFRLK
jgi:type II secretory pathway pseudopilin PulG